MNIRTVIFLLFALGAIHPALAQGGRLAPADRDTMAAASGELKDILLTIYTDSSEVARFTACRDLIKRLVATLDRPHSFEYDFGQLPGLSIRYPQDSSFRIFTWELNVDRDRYRHYGAIQRNRPELLLTPLLDRGDTWLENPENKVVTANDWLGYTVYDIVDGGTVGGRPYYFLFAYDSYSTFRRRKILDVLRFDSVERPVFGLPVFDTFSPDSDLPLADRARLILEYGAEATIALRYDRELGGIVYENLIMVAGNNGEGPVSMPDGSYHLLRQGDTGRWLEEQELFNHIYEEAPREVPKPGEGRDLLGRPKAGGGNE